MAFQLQSWVTLKLQSYVALPMWHQSYRIKHDEVNPNSMLHITRERCEWFDNIYCRPLFVGHSESKPITPLGTMDGSSN